jgi:serine/threonine protein phosphatase 1
MSKTYFISSDTHSHLTPLLAALMKEGYDKTNPDHVLIIIGDLFDRGTESRQLYDFIRSIPRSNRILLIIILKPRMFSYHN